MELEEKVYLITGIIPCSKNSKFVHVTSSKLNEKELALRYLDLFDVDVIEITDDFMESLLANID